MSYVLLLRLHVQPLLLRYLISLTRIGLSFLLPNTCVQDAETNLRGSIEYFNKKKLKGISVRLVKRCSTSWVSIINLSALQIEIKLKDRVTLVNNNEDQPELARTSGRDLHLYNEIVETSNDPHSLGEIHLPQEFIVATTQAAELEMEDMSSNR